MKRCQAPDILGLLLSVIPRCFLCEAKLEISSCLWLTLSMKIPSGESSFQSETATRLPALRSALPRHQLLLLLTKVPAAQSQRKEVVTLELVEDLLPHLRRELFQTSSVLGLPRIVFDLRLASFFGDPAPGPGAGGRRSLSLRHLPLSNALTGKPALAQ